MPHVGGCARALAVSHAYTWEGIAGAACKQATCTHEHTRARPFLRPYTFYLCIQLAKLKSAYMKFLDEAVAAYKRLVVRLQWAYGEVGPAGVVEVSAHKHLCLCTWGCEVWPQYGHGGDELTHMCMYVHL